MKHVCLRLLYRLLTAAVLLVTGAPVLAQDNPFGEGWTLIPAYSSLSFQSTKNTSVVETNKFSSVSGTISPDGVANVKVQLNSIDTGIDLRNVRMRFLFFEVFKYPDLTITTRIDPADVSDLRSVRRKQITQPVDIEMHGVKQTLPIDMTLTLITDEQVSVASRTPIPVEAKMFGLEAGVQRLQEAANVALLPSGSVSFDLVFQLGAGTSLPTVTADNEPRQAAIESVGNLTNQECVNRFETMSRAEAIFFESGSARLDEESRHLLDEVVAIIDRCPGLRILISGHTDSRGSDAANQVLSERRAASVHDYLADRNIAEDRMQSKGFGESQPAFPNDNAEHLGRNRRIEFSVLQ